MKVIAFAGSNSKKSINHELVNFAASKIVDSEVVRLGTYDFPIYNMDIEESEGIPKVVKELAERLSDADAYIIAVSEHNGNISAFFKNVLDWLSRNDRDFLKNKKVLLMSTSPGKGGAKSALQVAEKTLPYFGATVISTISLSSFFDNFSEGKVIDETFNTQLSTAIAKLT